jgi:hypothetical protein
MKERVGATAMSEDQPYNYAVFPPDDDVEHFRRFPEILNVGERAPDPDLINLETGEIARLSDYSRRGLTVVEFGSLT